MAGEDAAPGTSSRTEGASSAPVLTFPDSPRMELDQLLTQLVERAQEVMHTQGRLRGLLRANQAVIGELGMPAVLHHIVEAARELVGARYAGLGVVGPDGGISQFIRSGPPGEGGSGTRRLRPGADPLEALVAEVEPVGPALLGEEPGSSAFPAGHPSTGGLLVVPVRVRGELFGKLYLAQGTRGEFTPDDEELVQSLAATAGVVVDNARLYQSARTRGEWLQASAAVTRQLLSVDTTRPLHLIAERTREIAGADMVNVVLPAEDGELTVEVAEGTGVDDLPGHRLPQESLSGRVMATGEALRLGSSKVPASLEPLMAAGVETGPAMFVPLLGSQRVHGVLAVVRLRGAPEFSAVDLEMASSFANQAGVALELAEARAEQQRSIMLEERERIAADLHDHVIQRLFAAGLSLNALATTLGAGPAADRVVETVEVLDDTIGQIRDTIFQLHRMSRKSGAGLRSQVLDVVSELSPTLGFEPGVRLTGLLDTLVDPALTEDLVAVLREALTNVARHAGAGTADVDVVVRGDRLVLEVRDDGVGPGTSTRRSGLATMRRRAERRGGDLALTAREPSGSVLRWSVPLG